MSFTNPSNWRTLRYGMKGPDVAAWQAQLEALDYDVTDGVGEFDNSTFNATKSFQWLRGLVADGIVGKFTKAAIKVGPDKTPFEGLDCLNRIEIVPAKNFTWANRSEVKWIVLHSMETSEAANSADNVAKWFAGPDAPRASAHWGIDADSIIEMVPEQHVAWHAKGANRYGIGIEHAGRARQTEKQWRDAYSEAMLLRSACVCAAACRRWGIPIEYVDREGLKRGDRGITTHNEVTWAFRKSDHVDPGKHFPMSWYLLRVNSAFTQIK